MLPELSKALKTCRDLPTLYMGEGGGGGGGRKKSLRINFQDCSGAIFAEFKNFGSFETLNRQELRSNKIKFAESDYHPQQWYIFLPIFRNNKMDISHYQFHLLLVLSYVCYHCCQKSGKLRHQ